MAAQMWAPAAHQTQSRTECGVESACIGLSLFSAAGRIFQTPPHSSPAHHKGLWGSMHVLSAQHLLLTTPARFISHGAGIKTAVWCTHTPRAVRRLGQIVHLRSLNTPPLLIALMLSAYAGLPCSRHMHWQPRREISAVPPDTAAVHALGCSDPPCWSGQAAQICSRTAAALWGLPVVL